MTGETPTEFVLEIANESPITPDRWTNVCKFCRAAWAEENFDTWLEREREGSTKGYIRDHHNDDCIWVRANQIVRAS